MIKFDDVKAQLARIGSWPTVLGRPEKKELANILHPDENIMQAAVGWYDGGIALLCATDQRLLLIDKKLMFLNLEDLRYDMIAEVMYQNSALDACVTITCSTKTLSFKSLNAGKLRSVAAYIQSRLLEASNPNLTYQQAPTTTGIQQQIEQTTSVTETAGISDYERWVNGRGSATAGQYAQAAGVGRNPYRASPFRRRRLGGMATIQQFEIAPD